MQEFQSENRFNHNQNAEESVDFSALRDQLGKIKESGKDSHFEFIDIKKLTNEDLWIFNKVNNGMMVDSDKEFQDYRDEVIKYINEKRTKNINFKSFDDPRANFLNMLLNKIVVNTYFKRHPEKRAA